MKYKILAKTFNGIDITPEIDIFILLGKGKNILPLGIYQEIQNEILELKNIEKLDFYLFSKDLENLIQQNVNINYTDLKDLIIKLLLEQMDKNLPTNITNQKLIRANQFFDDKKINEAQMLLSEINVETLSSFDKDEYILLDFKLKTTKSEDDFRTLIETVFQNNPIRVKQTYFIYIKYLEDIRDEKTPLKLIKEFEEKYPLSILSSDEKSLFYYLNGRANYARGEFLIALKELSKSKEFINKNDEKLLASIYNTATNSFSDNLFFEEAEQIAKKSIIIRNKLKLVEVQESISLLAGIYFKNNQFQKAYEQYEDSLRLLNHDQKNSKARLFNYLAKSSIMLNSFDKAKEYIEESEKLDCDNKGFLILVKYLYFYMKKDFNELNELFKITLLLPENKNKYDNFVISWCYVFLAQYKFEINEFDSGVNFLFKAMNYFILDNYILEAFYVSLNIYKYDVPKKDMDNFFILIEDFEINKIFEEFVLKHQSISNDYSEIFDIKSNSKNLLNDFFEDTYDITSDNYCPELVTKLMNQFCLI